ncbi:MAG: cyanophycinase [Hymenobacteraceae bacterium]|nr:cyanophycinase [Hymenobacteraceae bacterium]
MPASVPAAPPTGTLIAWGGGDDERLLQWLYTHCAGQPAGASRAEIIVAATPVHPLVTGRNYVASLRRLGFAAADVMHFAARTPPDSPAHLRRLAAGDLVFFTGGDQERVTAALRGTQFLTMLHDRYHHAGLTIAGTSAGAAALAERMIVSGHGWRSLLSGRVRIEAGLGLAPGAFLDTHFAERGRFARLAHAVLREPATLGVGLAEETGVIWQPGAETGGTKGHRFTVIGDEVVTVVDGSHSSAPGLETVPYNEPISGRDLRLHLLADGQEFAW